MNRLKSMLYVAMLSFAALLFSGCASESAVSRGKSAENADIVVYGGTSGGVVSAVRAAKSGKKVILIAPEKHLGAMSSAGLTFTDSGKTESIGGLSREFYHRIWREYQKPDSWNLQTRESFKSQGQGTKAIDDENKVMWIFEPKVAERVFENWLKEFPNVKVVKGERLLRDGTGVEKIGGRIASIRTESGIVVRAKMFIDATFEGDLMAAAGCSYMTGRESNKEYGETFNGYRKTMKHNYHFFKGKVSPYREPGNPSSGLLKFANIQPRLETGTADKKIQAYCFRMCLTLNPDSPNWKKIEKPANYNPEDYEMLLRAVCSEPKFFPMIVSPMPNFKSDCNNRGAVSLDFIGGNYNYPEASYAEREKIVKAHLDYQTGLVYFLQNDPRVPKNIQDRFKKFGYSKDEFVDTGHMPFYLYVREARRMKGEYVMTQHDCQNARSTPDPVGMGSYGLDSHNTSRFIDENGFIQNEGDVEVWLKKPYKIAYGAIIPQKSECQNLLVPVACSSTHIAYGSIRMEPVFMILGHSAAAAASMAIDEGCAVQDIDRSKLASVLLTDGQVLEHKAAPKTKK